MILETLIGFPLIAALFAYRLNSNRAARVLLVVTAAVHFCLASFCLVKPPELEACGWLGLDPAGSFFLLMTSLLFLAVSAHTAFWLDRERSIAHSGGDLAHKGAVKMPERIFIPCLMLFLSTMTLVVCSRHFGLLWVAVEGTTLASAPLICFQRTNRSLEAMWKYLLICSVGIGLALFGSLMLSVAGQFGGPEPGLSFHELVENAGNLHHGWLKTAFVLLLAGYGVKMGLAPFHTWLPDAHSEAPSIVSALLSGSLLNCAFLGILRAREVCVAAGLEPFCQKLLIALGLLSLLVAAAFIVRQADYKRLLAYSSVEHMGVAAIGAGIGGEGLFGSLYHLLNHTLAKGMLFMLAGNILMRYGTRGIHDVKGVLRALPGTGALWLLGLLAITGTPPFGLFISEFVILKAALNGGHYFVAASFLALLCVAFAGLAYAFLNMALGARPGRFPDGSPIDSSVRNDRFAVLAAPGALCALAILLGVWMPKPLADLLHVITATLG